MACLFCFEKPKTNFEFIKLTVLYLLAVLPFVYYLQTAISHKVSYTPSSDWIYSYYRHPHHIGLFRDLSYFYSKHFYGVLLSFIALIFSIHYFKIAKKTAIKRLNHFVFLSILGVLFFVVVAYFDTQGVLLKYYPFRINTVTTFALTLLITIFLYKGFKANYKPLLSRIVFMISLLFLLKSSVATFKGLYQNLKQRDTLAIHTVGEYVRAHTKKDAVVLSFVEDLSITRRFERDQFVVYKFIPAVMNDIPDWYERIQYKSRLTKNIDLLKQKRPDYKIDYLLSKDNVDSDILELVFSENGLHLYKVKL